VQTLRSLYPQKTGRKNQETAGKHGGSNSHPGRIIVIEGHESIEKVAKEFETLPVENSASAFGKIILGTSTFNSSWSGFHSAARKAC
jgi:hypothetical protein